MVCHQTSRFPAFKIANQNRLQEGFVLRTVTALVARQRHWQRPLGLVLMVHPISFASAGYVLESKQTLENLFNKKKQRTNQNREVTFNLFTAERHSVFQCFFSETLKDWMFLLDLWLIVFVYYLLIYYLLIYFFINLCLCKKKKSIIPS